MMTLKVRLWSLVLLTFSQLSASLLHRGTCKKCDPGFSRDYQSTTLLEDGKPRRCSPCVRCKNGKYSTSGEICVTCTDCTSILSRTVSSVCTSDSDTVCGHCLSGFYDIYRELEGKEDLLKPCRKCEYADEDVEECQPHSPPVHTKNLTVPLVVFGIVVGIPGLIFIVCLSRKYRCKTEQRYRPLVASEHPADSNSIITTSSNQQTERSLSSRSSENRVFPGSASGTRATLAVDGHKNQRVLRGGSGESSANSVTGDDNQPKDSSEDSPAGISNFIELSYTNHESTVAEIHPRGPTTIGLESFHDQMNITGGPQTVSHMDAMAFTATIGENVAGDEELFEDAESIESGNWEKSPEETSSKLLDVDTEVYASPSDTPVPVQALTVPHNTTLITAEEGAAASSSTNRICKNFFRSFSYPLDIQKMQISNGSEASTEERKATTPQLEQVAEELGPTYIGRLLRELRLHHADEKLEDLKARQFMGRELVYQGLHLWRQHSGRQATDQQLCSALIKIGRKDISDNLQLTRFT